MSRNRSKIGLCGPKSVHDHGDGISYFCDLDFYGSFLKPAHGYIEEISVKRSIRQTVSQARLLRPSDHLFLRFSVEGPHFELFPVCDVKI